MKIVVSIDSFKGSLSSLEAGNAIKEGISKVMQDAEVCVKPLADGGEGTVDALTHGMDGVIHDVQVTGPLGNPVRCSYGVIAKTHTAIIEMSGAAGITLVEKQKRNPLMTTTFGVGEVIKDAILKGCRHFIIGIGGSATNDGGIGMLQALGFGILDQEGNQVPFGAKGLEAIAQINSQDAIPELKECTFRVACDVDNPLYGSLGCSVVFGPQKGTDEEMVRKMDQWMVHYATMTQQFVTKADPNQKGAGAAGGLGFAFQTFLNASLEPGINIVLEETELEKEIKKADFVITGEGRLDDQTVMGKAPIGVAKLAKKYQKPVIAFAGCLAEKAYVCNEAGIDAFFPILREIVSESKAMEKETASKNLTATVEQVFRLMQAVGNK